MDLEDYYRLPEGELVRRIQEAKKGKNAVVLVHNYQKMVVQRIADFLGDSLGLSQQAERAEADLIVFCGVRFMAETAKILNPDKKVVMPDVAAGCPMADMTTPEELNRMKAEHPDAVVVAYVNTTAAVKAESDICCTSANAVKVVQSLGRQKVLFVPDQNLANYVADQTGADTIAWPGYCYVHHRFTAQDVEAAKAKYPEAKVIVHPECRREVIALADEVASTSGMARYVDGLSEEALAKGVIIGTEEGLIDQLQRKHRDALLVPLREDAICFNMKLTDLPKVAWSIENERYEISVPEDIRQRAKKALDRMLELA
jgi:quinolinate synthase